MTVLKGCLLLLSVVCNFRHNNSRELTRKRRRKRQY